MSYENYVQVDRQPGFCDAAALRAGIARQDFDGDTAEAMLSAISDSDMGFVVGDEGGDVTVYGSKEDLLAWFRSGVRILEG